MNKERLFMVKPFLWGLVCGMAIVLLLWIPDDSRTSKTIARLEAERDSLKIDFRSAIRQDDYGRWLDFESKTRPHTQISVNLDSMVNDGRWPPDMLKHKPLKREVILSSDTFFHSEMGKFIHQQHKELLRRTKWFYNPMTDSMEEK